MAPFDAPGQFNLLRDIGGTMHLIIDEAVASELPRLLDVILKAWPGWGTVVAAASRSECLSALENRSADAAIVRLQGIESSEVGKFAALPLATSLEGTMIIYVDPAASRSGMFARLAELAQSAQQTDKEPANATHLRQDEVHSDGATRRKPSTWRRSRAKT